MSYTIIRDNNALEIRASIRTQAELAQFRAKLALVTDLPIGEHESQAVLPLVGGEAVMPIADLDKLPKSTAIPTTWNHGEST